MSSAMIMALVSAVLGHRAALANASLPCAEKGCFRSRQSACSTIRASTYREMKYPTPQWWLRLTYCAVQLSIPLPDRLQQLPTIHIGCHITTNVKPSTPHVSFLGSCCVLKVGLPFRQHCQRALSQAHGQHWPVSASMFLLWPTGGVKSSLLYLLTS